MFRPFLTLIIIALAVSSVFSQEADFLIVENPAALILYNKYQQKISAEARVTFTAFTPFQIIAENELLSDQITLSSRCLYENEIYFLLKEDDQQYIDTGNNNYLEIYRNCEIIGDTISILKADAFPGYKTPADLRMNKIQLWVASGELWKRLFKYKNLYYLRRLGIDPYYCWCRLPADDSWQIAKPSPGIQKIIPELIIQKITMRIAAANASYHSYFSYFNQQYAADKFVPQWLLSISDSKIEGTLNDSALMTQLSRSNRYLFQDLENIILGSDLVFKITEESFTIQAKQTATQK